MSLIPLGSLFKVAGAGVQGYGEDKQDAIKELLQQNAAKRQGVQDAVENALKDAQTRKLIHENQAPVLGEQPYAAAKGAEAGAIADAQVDPHVREAGGKITAETPGLVAREGAMAPAKAASAAATAQATAPFEVKKAVDIATQSPQAATSQVLPGANGGPAQLVVTGGKDRSHPIGSTLALPTVDKQPTGGGGMGSARGFGQGGPLGAASGLASVKEMHAAHPNLQTFEKGLVANVPTNQLDALDRFRQRLANDLQTHGAITAAQSAEAERELAASNPDLAIYGRNLKQWIVSDMNLSRGGTDERARMDAAVSGLSIPLSSMSPAQRSTYINQIWEGRQARLSGLDQAVPGMEAMLKRLGGQSSAPSVSTGDPDADAILAKYPKKAATPQWHPPQ